MSELDKINYSQQLLEEKTRADRDGFSGVKYVNNIKDIKKDNKPRESVLISYPEDLNDYAITIFLSSFIEGKYHRAYMHLFFEKDVMKIQDIGVFNEAKSRGYGDLLMATALEIAKLKSVSTVTGKMSSDSTTQRDRQIKYYSKYGFLIDENDNLKLVF